MYTINNVNFINLNKKKIEVKDIDIPSDENKTIDGTGKYLMPGLVDMHTHITPASAKHYLLSGVTTVRNTGGNYQFIQSIDTVSPDIYATYRFIDGDPGLWGPTSYGSISTNDINTAVDSVKELDEQNAAFTKVYGNIQEDVLKAVINESRTLNLEVAGDFLHSKTIDAVKAADYGVSWLEHASSIVQSLYPDYHSGISEEAFDHIRKQGIDENRLTEVLTYLIQKNVKIVPTLSLYKHLSQSKCTLNGENLKGSRQFKYFQNETVFTVNEQFTAIQSQIDAYFMKKEYWQYRIVQKITKRYIELGGEVYIGTDAPAGIWVYPGLSMIEELNEFKHFDLSSYDILHKAAVEAKHITVEDHSWLLVNDNPLQAFENILNLDSVFKDGQRISFESIASHKIDTEKMHQLIKEMTGSE